MKRFKLRASRTTTIAVWGLSLAIAASGSAVAAAKITGANIKDGSVEGVDLANGSVSSIDIKNGGVGLADISTAAKKALRSSNTPGAAAAGAPGSNGKDGKDGVNGTNGTNGTDGEDGADAPVDNQEYGVFSLYVDRNSADGIFPAGGPWATLATPNVPDAGVPATTNGTFAVSCRPGATASEYCLVAIRGAVRSAETNGATLHARVLVNQHGGNRPGATAEGVIVYGSEGEGASVVDASPLTSTAPTALNGSLLTLSWGSNSLTGALGSVLLADGTAATNTGVYVKLPASGNGGYTITVTGTAVDTSDAV